MAAGFVLDRDIPTLTQEDKLEAVILDTESWWEGNSCCEACFMDAIYCRVDKVAPDQWIALSSWTQALELGGCFQLWKIVDIDNNVWVFVPHLSCGRMLVQRSVVTRRIPQQDLLLIASLSLDTWGLHVCYTTLSGKALNSNTLFPTNRRPITMELVSSQGQTFAIKAWMVDSQNQKVIVLLKDFQFVLPSSTVLWRRPPRRARGKPELFQAKLEYHLLKLKKEACPEHGV